MEGLQGSNDRLQTPAQPLLRWTHFRWQANRKPYDNQINRSMNLLYLGFQRIMTIMTRSSRPGRARSSKSHRMRADMNNSQNARLRGRRSSSGLGRCTGEQGNVRTEHNQILWIVSSEPHISSRIAVNFLNFKLLLPDHWFSTFP